ncbi:hypothetical protein [Natrialba taiwanensis]|uniref:hypothetical protein n=1 Tax=Natrialba taiwanensis TaxID=160846 RepID=UPI0012683728|nr:hypothetical protein [Natrialba taiwanensis]
MNRRKVLQAIGIGASGVGVTSSVTANEQSNPYGENIDRISVTKLERSKRNEVIEQINTDRDSRFVREKIREKGWKIDWDDVVVRRAVDRAEDYVYDYVIANASKKGDGELDEEEMVFWWFGNANTDLGLEQHTFAQHVWKQDSLSSKSNTALLRKIEVKL